jgi:hypothetical protein
MNLRTGVNSDTAEWGAANARGLPAPYAWYAVGVALFALAFGLWQVEPVPFEAHVAGVVTVAVAAFPAARWWARGRADVPMFELVCLSYGLQYGVVLYLQPNEARLSRGPLQLSWESTERALLLSALGIASLIAGRLWADRLALFERLPRLDLPLEARRRVWYFALAFGVGLGGMLLMTLGVVTSSSPLGAVVALFSGQANLALFLLTYHVYRRAPGRCWKLGLYAMVLVVVLLGLSKGMLEEVLVPVVLVFVARWQASGRIPWRAVLAGALIFAALEPIKGQYRKQAWQNGQATALTLAERATIWGRVIGGLLQEPPPGAAGGGGSGNKVVAVTARFDLLHFSAWVFEQTPGRVPYFNGASYDYLINTWVPRFLWPGKPIAQQANIDFALTYGFLDEEQIKGTIIGIGHIAEAYANFGAPGVIFVMLLQGVFFAALSRALNGAESEGGRAIYVIIMVTFLQGIVSTTAGMFGGIIQSVVANALILRFFASGFRAARRPETGSS